MLNFIINDYPIVGSTNDEAKSLWAQGAGEGTVVRAERQTAGRGRRGRQWVSDPGNLYCSLLLMPQCSLMHVGQLSFVMAIAVGQAILPFLTSPQILSYKWPNDLLLQNEKVAGILIETESQGLPQGRQPANVCIVGIGLNLNSIPHHPIYPITALNHHTQSNLIENDVFAALLAQIKHYYDLWQCEGFDPIRDIWKQRAHRLGQNMTIMGGNNKVSGQFIDINSEGALLLKGEDGHIHSFMSAEVF